MGRTVIIVKQKHIFTLIHIQNAKEKLRRFQKSFIIHNVSDITNV